MSNDECSAYVRSKMSEGYHDLDYICEALIDTCLEKGSRDNMSAVIVSLPAAVFGEKKIDVIKAVRSVTDLGLKEAKEFVEGAPGVVKDGLNKEAADELKEKLEAAGASVEVK